MWQHLTTAVGKGVWERVGVVRLGTEGTSLASLDDSLPLFARRVSHSQGTTHRVTQARTVRVDVWRTRVRALASTVRGVHSPKHTYAFARLRALCARSRLPPKTIL